MTRLALLVLALGAGGCGVAATPAAISAQSADPVLWSMSGQGWVGRTALVHIRNCDYVISEGGSDGGRCVIHAADCPNPAHQVSR